MIKVGLTGNIASGKSTAEKFFLEKKIPVIDADKINADLIANDETVKKKLLDIFSDFNILENGEIAKRKIAQIVFQIPEKKKELENLLHPLILQKINNFFIQHKNEQLAIASVPLLFELNWEYIFDKIILIHADDTIKIERIKQRGLTAELAQQIIKSQLPFEKVSKKSNFIVSNSSDIKNFYSQLDKVFLQLITLTYPILDD